MGMPFNQLKWTRIVSTGEVSGLEVDLGSTVRMVQLVKANVTTEERSLSQDQGLGEKQQARGLEKETTWWKTE